MLSILIYSFCIVYLFQKDTLCIQAHIPLCQLEKCRKCGGWEDGSGLEVLSALPEDLSSIPRTQVGQLTSIARDPTSSLASVGTCTHVALAVLELAL